MQYTYKYNSPLGKIILASDGENLIGLWFDKQKYFPTYIKDSEEKSLPIFKQTKKWLDIYFSGKSPKFIPHISIEGASPFRKKVWEILLTIPFGKTISYGEIAKQIKRTGTKVSAQAVGGAVGHNPISIIIPCHRVIGSNGNLTGYAGGLDKKLALLKLENPNID